MVSIGKYGVGEVFVVRLRKGEEIISCLKETARKLGIKGALFMGIGAVEFAKIGVFSAGEYKTREVRGDLEVVSLVGNISLKDNEPFIHAHITLADSERTYAGHLFEAVVSVTAEIFILTVDGEIRRSFDEETGLYLMDLRGL
ncbi:MAG: PPC domain-containing DNA-binding protein [Candidatus Baldrarchaeia archaeon]